MNRIRTGSREKLSLGFAIRSDTNKPVQPQKMTETGYFGFRDFTKYAAKRKGLRSCEVIAQLICAFVFAIAKKQVFSG